MSVDPKSYASQGALRDLGTDRDDKEVIRSSFKLPQGIGVRLLAIHTMLITHLCLVPFSGL